MGRAIKAGHLSAGGWVDEMNEGGIGGGCVVLRIPVKQQAGATISFEHIVANQLKAKIQTPEDFEKIAKEFEPILIDGEHIEKAYKIIRDMFIFTNKRLILVEKQGVTGSKVDYQSIPYSSIKKFSKESGGILDLDAELKIWITGESIPVKKQFGKDNNINEVYQILSKHILK